MMQGTQKSPGERTLDQGEPSLHITGTTSEDYESNYSIKVQVQHDIQLYRTAYNAGHAAGFEQGLRDGLAYGPAHPRVQQSVANFFDGWDGADNAHKRSTARFWEQYGERDAA